MAEEEKKDEFNFDATGEALGYISLEQARVVAMQAAREAPGEYGRVLSDTRMAYQLVEQENGEDYYIITLSFRPEGDFAGTEGQEQFFIEKEGTVAYRQVLSLPRSSGGKRSPVVPIAIGVVVVIVAVVAVALAAGNLGQGGESPDTGPLPASTPLSSISVESTAEAGTRNGLPPDVPPAQVKFPGFDFQLTEGTFWEYKWETESSSFCRDCPRGARTEAGTFLVSLGQPIVIQGNTVHQVDVSGEYKKKDGKDLSFVPRWEYVGVNDHKIVASEDGSSIVVIFDGEKGEWQGSGFFSSRFGTDTAMSARQGQIPEPISRWSEVRQGPVLAVGQSAKDGECTYERLTGTTVCDDNRSKSSQSELFREGVGPVAYFFASNFSTGEGLTSFSASSREYVGLTSSSLLGDVSSATTPRILTTPSSGPSPLVGTPAPTVPQRTISTTVPSMPSRRMSTPAPSAPRPQIATTAPTVPQRLPGSGVAIFATPAPSAEIAGILTTPSPFTPAPPPTVSRDSEARLGTTWKVLSPTWGYTCGITTQGQAYCWGAGENGVLGNGAREGSVTPVAVSGGLTFETISARAGHTCGVTTGGAAYCWGEGGNGALGNGSTDDQASPVPVAGGLTFKSVSAMGAHTCGVTTLDGAYCWGRGDNGRLGNASTDFQTTPVLVSGGLLFNSMSGSSQTCGVTTTGAAYCWGTGGLKLGVGSIEDQLKPAPVSGNLTFTTLATGHESTCGLTTQGSVYCWGADLHGRLGNGGGGDSAIPMIVVGGLKFTSLTSGADQVCGIATGGAAYCWGRGQEGQLGNGSTDDKDQPVAVSGGLKFASLNAGTGITCGVTTAGVAYCWGDGGRGQLGHGKKEIAATLVRVSDPG